MNKDEFLSQLGNELQALSASLEGVPDAALEEPEILDSYSLKEVFCLLTAWDGEYLRRLAFVCGEQVPQPPSLEDEGHWQAWAAKQIAVKKDYACPWGLG